MTRLRFPFLLAAVAAGDYAVLMLIDGRSIDFVVAAVICAGSAAAAGLIAYAGRRRRQAVARGRLAVWERRDQQAAAAGQQCAMCADVREKLSESTRLVDRQGTMSPVWKY